MRVPTPKKIVAATALIVAVTLVAPFAASAPSKPPSPAMHSEQASAPITASLDGQSLSALTTTTTVPPTTTTEAPTTTTTAPAPEPEPVAEAASAPTGGGDPNDPATWDRLAQCEANGDWTTNTGNGYSGGLQFHPATWSNYGGETYAPYAYQASRSQQIEIAQRVWQEQGWGAWPACTRSFGWQ